MIKYRKYVKFRDKGIREIWEGWFLFGFILLYARMIRSNEFPGLDL